MLVAIGIVVVLWYLIFYGFSGTISVQSNINSSYVSIFASTCSSCSDSITSAIYNLLTSHGYTNSEYTEYLNTKVGLDMVSNDLVTSVPSVVLPADTNSANILPGLIYLNMFNVVGNYFVANTPFLAGLSRNVTYLSITQNRTITAWDIYNVSDVFNTTKNRANANFIYPGTFLLQANSTNLSIGNKTEIILVYSASPFSAIQSLVLESALSDFGSFSNQSIGESSQVSVSPTETLGPQPFYAFDSMKYTSPYFAMEAYNLSFVSGQTAQRELFQYDQNSGSSLEQSLGSFTPFFDVGGKYIEVSSMLFPDVFNGLNISGVDQKIASNATISRVFNDSVSFIDAVLCSAINYVEPICSSANVESQLSFIRSTI